MAYLRYGHTVTLKGGFLRGQWLQLKVTILRINFTKFLVHTTETSFSVFSCDIFKLFKLTEKQIAPGSLPIPNTLRVSHIQYKLCKETLLNIKYESEQNIRINLKITKLQHYAFLLLQFTFMIFIFLLKQL